MQYDRQERTLRRLSICSAVCTPLPAAPRAAVEAGLLAGGRHIRITRAFGATSEVFSVAVCILFLDERVDTSRRYNSMRWSEFE